MGKVVSSIANVFTGADQTRAAGERAAAQQSQAARDASAAAAFRPVGMTTRFGSSQFTREIDPATGMPYISSAGYTAAPELAALQNQLFGGFNEGAGFAQQQGQQLGALSPAAQRLFGLGGQILPTGYNTAPSAEAQALAAQYQTAQQGLMPSSFQTGATPEAMAYVNQLNQLAGQVTPTSYDPAAAAQQYYQQQQELMQPGREAQLAQTRSGLFGAGRTGLGVNTATGGAPTSPEMQAYYNALARSDRELAAQSTDIARQRLQSDISLGTQLGGAGLAAQQQSAEMQRANMLQNLGLSLGFGQQGYATVASAEDLARQRSAADIGLGAGLFGTGAGLLGTQATGMAGAYAPLQTQLGLAGQVEGMAQMPYQLGIQLGQAQQPGQQAGAQMYQQGMNQAAQTQYGATQAANAANASFWGGLVSAAGTAGGAYFAPRGVGTMPR